METRSTRFAFEEEESGDGASSLLTLLARAESAVDRERAEAPALVAELLALPPQEQVERAGGDPRLRSFGVGEHLIELAAERLPEDLTGRPAGEPEESERLARLALEVAERLEGVHPPAVVADFQARAWALLGEARRRRGDLEGAVQGLHAGASCLALGTGDLLVEARLLEFEAAVRQDQGRLREAAASLKLAGARYKQIGEAEEHQRLADWRDELLDRLTTRSFARPA
jgi:tetratricopeptide (TPR) repeat protein